MFIFFFFVCRFTIIWLILGTKLKEKPQQEEHSQEITIREKDMLK